MKVVYGCENIDRNVNSIVTMGTFDGVHIGHMHLIGELVRQSKKVKGRSVILTFDPHPQAIVHPEKAAEIRTLTTIEERISLFEKSGVDVLLIAPFTRDLMAKSGETFVDEFLIGRIGLSRLILGYDHAFGKNRSGNYQALKPFAENRGFMLEQFDALLDGQNAVSSTMIRRKLSEGKVKEAAHLFGRNYSIRGSVQKGDQRGRTIGFPTANIKPDHSQKLIPANGVYACYVEVDGKRHNAVTNIGLRPTFDGLDNNPRIETYLLNFSDDIYHKTVKIEFLDRIREEQKFPSIEALINQIKADVNHAQMIVFK